MFAKYHKYGNRINSHDLLKFAAILFMFSDHLGRYILPDYEWLRVIGRLAAPTFLFLVGYSIQYRFRRDVLLWAILLTIYAGLINHVIFPLNILVPIILARLLLQWLEKKDYLDSQLPVIFLVAAVWWVVTFPVFDYGTQCFLFAICGYLAGKAEADIGSMIFFAATAVFYGITQQVLMKFDLILSILLVISLAALFTCFYRYKLTRYDYSGFMRMPVLFVSRYSLEFYVVHLIILQGLAAFVIDADKYQTFKWIE